MKPMTVVVVGCGGMGAGHANILAKMPEYKVLAVCDKNLELAQKVAQGIGCEAGGDYAALLAALKPDVASVCTDNRSHAPLAKIAIDAGVRGLMVEKPMAVHPVDAREMVAGCAKNNIVLAVNHQRRLGADLAEMKRLIDSGRIGTLRTMRMACSGDFLSDGTHLVDSAQFLTGDRMPLWIQAMLHRDLDTIKLKWKQDSQTHKPGWRFGHVVESGLMALWQFDDGLRVEVLGGDFLQDYTIYQDYLIRGSKGWLWRTGDTLGQNLFISDGEGGELMPDKKDWPYKPRGNDKGPWKKVELPPADSTSNANAIVLAYRALVKSMADGSPHPMSGDIALKDFEIVTGAYESARLGKRLALPVAQDRFPLELMFTE